MSQHQHPDQDELTGPQAEMAASLREALAAQPEPAPPGPGYEQALLAQAISRGRRGRRRRRLLGLAVGAGVAAGVVIALKPTRRPPEPPRIVAPGPVDDAMLVQIAELAQLAPILELGASLPSGAGVAELAADARAEQARLRVDLEAATETVRRELERDPPDLAAIDRGLERIATLEATARRARVHAWLRIRSQLTAEQRGQLSAGQPTEGDELDRLLERAVGGSGAPPPPRDVLTLVRRSALTCLELAVKREGKLAGQKLDLRLRIDSSGKTAALELPERFRHAFVGQCLASMVTRLPWPAGATAYDLELPLAFPTPPATSDADALAAQAMDAYVRGQFADSLDLTTRALALNPDHQMALRIQGATYCKLRNREGALATTRRLGGALVQFVRFVCHNEGIELSEPPREGRLTVATQPWARVWVDGRDTGKSTPILRLPLTPGKHILTLVAGQQRHIIDVIIRAGEETRVVRSFD
ncbi:MAG TPA: hypothetical protein VKN99_06070 [Polyangia bacterium]|nr:hypothetical protein [Polyangia bacterium]